MLKSQNSKFSGTHWGAYCESLHCSADLVAGGEGTRAPLRNKYPTPVLGPSIRPRFYRFYGSRGLTHYRILLLSTANMVVIIAYY